MNPHDVRIGRRRFLRAASLTCLSVGLMGGPLAFGGVRKPRELAFFHTHTGERLKVTYADETGYLDDSLAEINRFLRDFRTGEVYPIDTAVLDILDAAREGLSASGVFEVISGYRSPKTNETLRQQGHAVAKRSLHMQGRAIDVRLSGVPTHRLRKFCRDLKRGGVGYYPRSDFIHVDNGRVRIW
ncbi:MAG: DUF882 domain-containing protein [Gammaproteobacteria bacterium]|nr:DUF882 domain-containing protein [Gammaproteobacteria bacterium]